MKGICLDALIEILYEVPDLGVAHDAHLFEQLPRLSLPVLLLEPIEARKAIRLTDAKLLALREVPSEFRVRSDRLTSCPNRDSHHTHFAGYQLKQKHTQAT